MNFNQRIYHETGSPLKSVDIDTIQVNVGLVCNQQCVHCHVAASPKRKEVMSWEIMEKIIEAAQQVQCRQVDITGGAPELNPYFCRFIRSLHKKGFQVQVRTNLTVLLEKEMKSIPAFYRDHEIQLIASLPCYLEKNVDQQRGEGVYHGSIEALKFLNSYGYGIEPQLPLNLVYNPLGPMLPPNQTILENDYRRELKERYGIVFTHLLTLTNMPIGRFRSDLKKQNKDSEYMQLLEISFNPETIEGLMCRHQISVDWDGTLYDCDFNLALRWPVYSSLPQHINQFDPKKLRKRSIVTGEHCYGCTAGCGSSCSGALIAQQ